MRRSPTPWILLLIAALSSGCAWIPRSYLDRVDQSDRTEYDLVEGSPMYKLIPRGWIRPVDRPSFVQVAEADFLQDDEPVIVLERGGDARIYSTWFLDGHEVVNDTVGGDPVAVTWCPLVQAGVVFDRTTPDGRVLRLSASGRLWRDALVMYDRQTRSLWTQHDGRALVGASHDAGLQLATLPSARTTWADARVRYPQGRVLEKKADLLGGGASTIYDSYLARTDQLGIFGTHLDDSTLPGKTEVLAFVRPEASYAVALSELVARGGVAMSVGGDPVFLHALPGGHDGRVWHRSVEGGDVLLDLALSPDGRQVVEVSSGSAWDAVSGRALEAAEDLRGIETKAVYWFAWQQNHPDTRVWGGGGAKDPRAER